MPKSIPGVMKEFKGGKLHSGSKHGPVVTSRPQAIAIAMSEQRERHHPAGPGQSHHGHKQPHGFKGHTARNDR